MLTVFAQEPLFGYGPRSVWSFENPMWARVALLHNLQEMACRMIASTVGGPGHSQIAWATYDAWSHSASWRIASH